MTLSDILVCPGCKGEFLPRDDSAALTCASCGVAYPIREGVPILLADPTQALATHQGELNVIQSYADWKERLVMRSLTDAQIVLDFGAGRQELDDPCVIRMDLIWHPCVDVVADVHALPFRSGAIDFAFGGAVMEHVARPWEAIDELYRVLKPGGYVYADWSFIFAYHGYPHHYFNATVNGIAQAFRAFRQLEAGVTPYHGSPFALRSVLGTYLEYFRPTTQLEREFVARLHEVLWHPLDDFDRSFAPEDRFRVAAAVYYFGVKQPNGDEHVIPEPIWEAWQSDQKLQTRFPQPLNLSVPDNLMLWAKEEGRSSVPAIAQLFDRMTPFNKRPGPNAVRSARLTTDPAVLVDRVFPLPDEELKHVSLYFRRSVLNRAREGYEKAGLFGVIKVCGIVVLRAWHVLTVRLR
jgi:uncharacterized protein YbaR (Trm112 family)